MVYQAEKIFILLLTFNLLMLGGCGGDLSPKDSAPTPIGRNEARKRDFGNLFGDDFLSFGGSKKPGSPDMMGPAHVNPFIWRASLDVLSFMPLASADAVGGVIVTDWYMSSSKPSERVKVTIYVTNPQLRSDAVKVTIYKQLNKGGTWFNAPSDAAAATEMENIILSKARQLRVKHLEANK